MLFDPDTDCILAKNTSLNVDSACDRKTLISCISSKDISAVVVDIEKYILKWVHNKYRADSIIGILSAANSLERVVHLLMMETKRPRLGLQYNRESVYVSDGSNKGWPVANNCMVGKKNKFKLKSNLMTSEHNK